MRTASGLSLVGSTGALDLARGVKGGSEVLDVGKFTRYRTGVQTRSVEDLLRLSRSSKNNCWLVDWTSNDQRRDTPLTEALADPSSAINKTAVMKVLRGEDLLLSASV